MSKRIALIDADGILYAAALKGETVCDTVQMQLLHLSAIYKDCLKRIEEAIDKVDATDAFIILSDRTNFRTTLLPSYKGNRKASPRPLALDGLRGMIAEKSPYKTLLIKGLEADDVCGISQGQLNARGIETVIVSPDKDLLQIPGLVYQSIATNSKTKGVAQIVRISEDDGDFWHMQQTLQGDAVDNYKGCPHMGPVKAKRLLESTPKKEHWRVIVEAYEAQGLTEDDALVQARVARICRASDWDTERKEVMLWIP